MEKLANSSHYLDLASLDQLRSRAQKDDKAALKEVAAQFEGLFVQMLMQSMRAANAVFESDSPFNSEYTKFYEQMRDQQMAAELGNQGNLGLADMMVQQLSADGAGITPASALTGAQGRMIADASLPSGTNGQVNSTASIHTTGFTPYKIDAVTLDSRAAPICSSDSSATDTLKRELDKLLSANDLAAIAKPLNHTRAKAQSDQLDTEWRSPMAVIAPQGASPSTPSHFVKQLYPHAVAAAKQLGTTPEVLLAQSALETGWGQKMVKTPNGEPSHNYFNIKADGRWSGQKAQVLTLEYERGQAVKQSANFRVYDGIKQSFDDFVGLIENNERYQGARAQAASPQAFIRSLAQAGYATDPQYARKVLRVMEAVKALIPTEGQ
ncbi:MAG: flagellar assembly peptidoglycan hydrolase FlgJ [Shewanella sp.]